jgi:hypothetical protein
MSRNPELEALLQAKFDLDTCADDQMALYRQRFDELVKQVLAKSSRPGVSRERLEESLLEPYREFRRAKIHEERARLSRLR